ncbi:hypothetical protein D3C81_2222940 [compost metagenome]
MHRVMTLPKCSCGTRMVAVTIGSRKSVTEDTSGSFDGLSTMMVSPVLSSSS